MYENITLIIIGIILVPLGITNIKGNISTIHWYNRMKVKEVDRKKYGMLMGISTLVISFSLCVNGILLFFFESENISFIAGIGIIIGVALMLYAQFKYNKGLF